MATTLAAAAAAGGRSATSIERAAGPAPRTQAFATVNPPGGPCYPAPPVLPTPAEFVRRTLQLHPCEAWCSQIACVAGIGKAKAVAGTTPGPDVYIYVPCSGGTPSLTDLLDISKVECKRASLVDAHRRVTWVTVDGLVGKWKAQCPTWLVELVATFASLARQRGGNLYIVGFSRGAWYTTTIISKLSQGGVTRAVLLAPYFHGDNKVDQADVLASAADWHGTELLVVASRADACCPWAAEECGISRLCRPQHAVVIYDTYGHEDMRDALPAPAARPVGFSAGPGHHLGVRRNCCSGAG